MRKKKANDDKRKAQRKQGGPARTTEGEDRENKGPSKQTVAHARGRAWHPAMSSASIAVAAL